LKRDDDDDLSVVKVDDLVGVGEVLEAVGDEDDDLALQVVLNAKLEDMP